ncbi:hypothetical protein PHYSODRAFT_533798 [Phytophthora sojae]|uniref:Uncharacterized protein n=1 Tax=Phytophthora sojae (strain P6497) TaxID=1094619 RepID=G5AG53_PHYSP|nr:hypothetical protein PHYSODRAFT_533798 [Phytophthora sojae]EGZ05565.1 hypothetical protein PHYSODRAFT_533798 [Phytophthora sojae]|eukprot:XP_009539096.1 hypothetical protein PHYSODRAFT_533798 [Phytophthora sojae]
MPALLVLKTFKSSANAHTPGRSSPDSFTPASFNLSSASKSGVTTAVKRWGLSGQPWNTSTRSDTGADGPSFAMYHNRSCSTLTNAFLRSYQMIRSSRCFRRAWSIRVDATKLCSPQPLTDRKPFWAGA